MNLSNASRLIRLMGTIDTTPGGLHLLLVLAVACCNCSSGCNRIDRDRNPATGWTHTTDAAAGDGLGVLDDRTMAEDIATWPAPVFQDLRQNVPAGCVHPPVDKLCNNGWCRIPPGCFVLGSPEGEWGRALYSEEPVPVTLTRAFEIQQFETTQAEWTGQGLPNPSGLMKNGTGDCTENPHCPVGNVTWFEAVAYANLLSERHDPPLQPCYYLVNCKGVVGAGLACESYALAVPTVYQCEGYRLPTDAEWEYAVRAGTRTTFYSGGISVYKATATCYPDPNLERIAWFCYNSGERTHPVGLKEPNAWGLYDMAGNVAEWVHYHYHSGLALPGPATDPTTSIQPSRGGSFNVWSTLSRSAARMSAIVYSRAPGLGFRLARTLSAAP